jgi:hypothetical protein
LDSKESREKLQIDKLPIMSKKTFTHSQIIEKMIDLRIQREEVERQILELKPDFHNACHHLTGDQIDRIDTERAFIHFKTTPGKWEYFVAIDNVDRHLKQLKKKFRDIHEPISGREEYWAIKLVKRPPT